MRRTLGACSQGRHRAASGAVVTKPHLTPSLVSWLPSTSGRRTNTPVVPCSSWTFGPSAGDDSSSSSEGRRHNLYWGFSGRPDGWDGSLDDPLSLPQPCNTPTHEDDENLLASLRHNRFWTLTDQPGVDLLALDHLEQQSLTEIYGVLFGLDDNQQEGIYSLRAVGEDGMPLDTIIVFENKEDAERYACLLEVTMDPHSPHVFSISALELADFCAERSYQCRLEPSGSLLIPPDYNVGLTDWERASKLRSGCFSVLAKDPDAAAAGSETAARAAGGGGGQAVQLAQPPQQQLSGMYAQATGTGASAMAKYHQCMGKEELDLIRVQLEALLHYGDDF